MFNIEVSDGYMSYRLDRERAREKMKYMGVWALRTNIVNKKPEDIRDTYKLLYNVERSFRYLKTVLLRVRPIYHRLEGRIRAHVSLCTMSLNVTLFLHQAWKEFMECRNEGKGRKYGLTFQDALRKLDKVKIVQYEAGGKSFSELFIPSDEVLNELLVSLPINLSI